MRLALLVLAAVASAADLPAPSVRLETGNAAGLVAPGKESDLALVVANPGAAATARLAGTATEFDGAKQDFAQDVALPAQGEARVAVPLGAGRRGHRDVAWTLTIDGHAVAGHASFVYARPAGAGPDPAGFRYSVCSHPDRAKEPLQEREMAVASQIGIGTMRMGVGWEGLEPKPGEWHWERMDRLLDLAEKYRIEPQCMFAFCTQHAATPATMELFKQAQADKRKDSWLVWDRHMPDAAKWRAYVAAVVGRYKERVKLWEVWNEPDLDGFWAGSTDEYIALLRMAHEEAKKANPDCIVLSGGFAGVGSHPGHKLNPGLQERVLAEASDAFDVHAYHGHGLFPEFVQTVDGELARIRGKMPQPRPIYFNETAMHSSFGTEHRQAVALAKKLPFARARGAIGYTWYDLRNDGTDPADAEHNYGLLTIDFQPKPVYAVYNELIARMRGTRFAGALDLGPGRWALVFAGGGRRLLAAWNEASGLPEDPVALVAEGCTGGEAIDLMGNATPLPTRGGAVLVRLREEPQWIELPGGEAMPRVAGPLVTIAGETLIAPGESPRLTANLANPIAEPLAVNLSWRGADGAQRTGRVALPAGGRGELALAGAAPEPGGDPARPSVQVAYAIEGGPWSGTLAVPLRPVLRVPAGEPAARPADWTLDGIAAVVDYCTADPALRDQSWKGPQDLSARIWLGRSADALRIHVEVRDNVHHQAGDADTAWRGDGLQIGLQVPGQTGFFEIGAALHDDGRVLRSLWLTPAGVTANAQGFTARAARNGDRTTYDVEVPYAAFGLSDAILERGLRFNLVVNDNDGPLRKGFIRISPGIGEGKDADAFPVVRFDPRP